MVAVVVAVVLCYAGERGHSEGDDDAQQRQNCAWQNAASSAKFSTSRAEA